MKKLSNLSRTVSKTVYSCATIFALVSMLTACNKNTGSSGTQPGSTDVMYPATVSFYEGNNSAYPAVSEYKYDSQHRLIFMGSKTRYVNVSAKTVEKVYIDTDTLVVTNSFSGDIYTGQGVTSVSTISRRRNAYGPPYVSPQATYGLEPTDQSFTFLGYFKDVPHTHYFTYDNNGNLVSSKFITNAVGSVNSNNYDPGGDEVSRLTYKNYDDKPSPFSSIAGYRFISFLWSYPQDLYLGLSKHNPSQIIEESLDRATRKWYVYSQTDFTYTYDDQGYPKEIRIKMTYPSTATPDQAFYQTYNFTYTK